MKSVQVQGIVCEGTSYKKAWVKIRGIEAASIMATGRTNDLIDICVYKPELLSPEEFQELTDSILERDDGVWKPDTFRNMSKKMRRYVHIDTKTPLSSIGGEDTAYFFDDMQVEAGATPMGLGMQDGQDLVLWNLSKFPKGLDGKKKRKNRETKLKMRLSALTSVYDTSDPKEGDSRLLRGLHPVKIVQCSDLFGSLHGKTCGSKAVASALFKSVPNSRAELEKHLKLKGMEWEIGFTATIGQSELSPTERAYFMEMWVQYPLEDKDLSHIIKSVTFTTLVDCNGLLPTPIPPTTSTVTSPPYRFRSSGMCPSKIRIAILLHQPYASLLHQPYVNIEKHIKEVDLDRRSGREKNVKWTEIVNYGNINSKFSSICDIIKTMLTIHGLKDRCHCPHDDVTQCPFLKNIFNYCAGLNDLCITETMASYSETSKYLKDLVECTLYIGPVRNGIAKKGKLLPILCLKPYTIARIGSVAKLVQIWKKNVEVDQYQLPQGQYCVTYNGETLDLSSRVYDQVDYSVKRHYFSIEFIETDPRNIDQLLEFIEGPEDHDQKKKKQKKKRKANMPDKKGEGTKELEQLAAAVKLDREAGDLETQVARLEGEADHLEIDLDVPIGTKRGPAGSVKERGGCEGEEEKLIPRADEGSSLGHLQPKFQLLKEELSVKEAKLEEFWEVSRDLVETRGKEMTVLIAAVDDAEEKKQSMLKKVAKVDSQLAKLQANKEELMREVEGQNVVLNESLKKRRQLEDLIQLEVDEHKGSRMQLEKEIESLRVKIDNLTKTEDKVSGTVDKAMLDAQRFLLNIDKKIEAKESDLECPVCFEVCASPIYSCDEQHIICSECRPKVSY